MDVTVAASLVVERGNERLELPVVGGDVSVKALDDGVDDLIMDVQVPYTVDGVDVTPSRFGDLLSGAGETMFIEWTVTRGSRVDTFRTGLCVLETCEPDGAVLHVTGHGLLSRVRAHERRAAVQYGTAQRAVDAVRAILAEDNIETVVAGDVPRVAIPPGWIAGTDRWGSLVELVQSVPAVLRQVGRVVEVRAGLEPPETSEMTLRDGDGGTVVDVPRQFVREDRPNHVIVRGTVPDGPDFAVEAVESRGQFAPEVYGWVTAETVESSAVTSRAQAGLVARNRLYELSRQAHRLRVRAVMDWGMALDRSVLVATVDGEWLGRVTGIEWPADGVGEMLVEVAVA